jgi:hypothetical protein
MNEPPPQPSIPLAPSDSPDPQEESIKTPGVEEERRSDTLSWNRWKGSLTEITKIFRLADDLVEKATGETAEADFIGRFTVYLRGRERSFGELKSLEAELDEFDLDSIEGLWMSTSYSTDKVRISINFTRSVGAYASVSGKDPFAVAGVEGELKTALNRGRRWTQVGGSWPHTVSFWAPWVAILGLSLISLFDREPWSSIGFGLLLLAGCMLVTVLFMRYVEPKLVPPLELLSDSEPRTLSQVWKGRALKGLGFVVVAVAGAAINSFTGFLF